MSRDVACRGAARPASHACPVQILSAGVRAQINAIGRARTGPPVAAHRQGCPATHDCLAGQSAGTSAGAGGVSPAAAPRRGDSANISHLRSPVMNNINVPFAGPAEPRRARHPPQHSSTHRLVWSVTWSPGVGSWSIVGLIT